MALRSKPLAFAGGGGVRSWRSTIDSFPQALAGFEPSIWRNHFGEPPLMAWVCRASIRHPWASVPTKAIVARGLFGMGLQLASAGLAGPTAENTFSWP